MNYKYEWVRIVHLNVIELLLMLIYVALPRENQSDKDQQ
jgi:hypothetical protein